MTNSYNFILQLSRSELLKKTLEYLPQGTLEAKN